MSTFSQSRHRWRQHVPNVATGATLFLGLWAIEAARSGNADLGLTLVLLAIIPDGLDGLLARRWGAISRLGSHLDSLADLVAFGVAPGVVFAARHPEAPEAARLLVLALVAGAGAWRLARFQAEASGEGFSGLPITGAGPLFAVATCGALAARWPDALLWAAGVAVLMTSRVPYGRATAGPVRNLALVGVIAFVVFLAMDIRVAFMLAQLALMGYAATGLALGATQLAQALAEARQAAAAAPGGRGRAG